MRAFPPLKSDAEELGKAPVRRPLRDPAFLFLECSAPALCALHLAKLPRKILPDGEGWSACERETEGERKLERGGGWLEVG